MNNDRGYSLVELMIVIAIIGILGTYAKFNYSSGGAKLNQAARELYGNMQSARMSAIKTNDKVVIIFSPGTESYTIFQDNPAGGAWALDGIDFNVNKVTLASPIEMVSAIKVSDGANFTTYGYGSRGMAHSLVPIDTYEIRLKYPNTDPAKEKYLGVRLSFAGNIRVIQSSDGGTTWN